MTKHMPQWCHGYPYACYHHDSSEWVSYKIIGLCGRIFINTSRTRVIHKNNQRGQIIWQRIKHLRVKTTQKHIWSENAGRAWNKYLANKLTKIVFTQVHIDESVLYKGHLMYTLYVDDTILTGPDPQKLDVILT